MKWYGDRQAHGMETALYQGLQKAAAYGRTSIVRAISKPSRVGGGGRRRPGRGKHKGRPMRFNRSKPGKPPKRDTGKLAQSIFWSADRRMLMATVGTKKKYGVYLELGATVPSRMPRRKRYMVFGVGDRWIFTRQAAGFKLAARPYMLSTLKSKRRRIEQLIFGTARGYMARGGVHIG